jgi:hypothetical protein
VPSFREVQPPAQLAPLFERHTLATKYKGRRRTNLLLLRATLKYMSLYAVSFGTKVLGNKDVRALDCKNTVTVERRRPRPLCRTRICDITSPTNRQIDSSGNCPLTRVPAKCSVCTLHDVSGRSRLDFIEKSLASPPTVIRESSNCFYSRSQSVASAISCADGACVGNAGTDRCATALSVPSGASRRCCASGFVRSTNALSNAKGDDCR